MSKTTDLSSDFRKESVQPQSTITHNETAESVNHFKYLGMVMDFTLKFSKKCGILFKKGQQQLHFLRKLISFNVDYTTLTLSYRCFVQCSHFLNYMLVGQPKRVGQKQIKKN